MESVCKQSLSHFADIISARYFLTPGSGINVIYDVADTLSLMRNGRKRNLKAFRVVRLHDKGEDAITFHSDPRARNGHIHHLGERPAVRSNRCYFKRWRLRRQPE